MKKKVQAALLLAVLCLVSGCGVMLPDPMEKAEATMVPGVTAALHSPIANENNRDTRRVTLYFRYGQEPLLGSEARDISISQNEPEEKAVVEALVSGPRAGTTELARLFPDQVQVLSTVSQGDVLYVTFNEALLRAYADEPADWQASEAWRAEVVLRRKLAMAALVASITENFAYQSVQVLVQQRGEISTSLRLENAYFRDEGMASGLTEPFTRDESWLLTQQNTVKTVFAAWQERDWSRLYLYLAASDPVGGEPRPSREAAFQAWNAAPAITGFSMTAGSVSHDGARAAICTDITLQRGGGLEKNFYARTVTLYRDRGVWKIPYKQLAALMALMPGEAEQ